MQHLSQEHNFLQINPDYVIAVNFEKMYCLKEF